MNNNELTRKDIEIGDEFDVDYENSQVISFSIYAWFDVDKKFNINILKEDDTWLNMYGKYERMSWGVFSLLIIQNLIRCTREK